MKKRPTHFKDFRGINKPIPFTNGSIICEVESVFLSREDGGLYKPGENYQYIVIYGLSVSNLLNLKEAVALYENCLERQKTHETKTENVINLCNSVAKWWEEIKDSTEESYLGRETKVYEEKPDFVKKAEITLDIFQN